MSDAAYEQIKAEIAQIDKTVIKDTVGDIEFRVGEKGGVSVYGLGRFPVTLYYEQWNRLLAVTSELKNFMELNKPKLKLKKSTHP